jgi:hypothetical protein
VRHAAGEVPEVALLEVVDEVAALVVDGGYADFSFEDWGTMCQRCRSFPVREVTGD